MRSQPTADRAPADRTATDTISAATTPEESMRFRGASLDDAVAAAEAALGGPVRVLEANRIRRGGIGGFFASDLGVEVTVVPEEETIEQALERLVARSEADERDQWIGRAPRLEAAPRASVSAGDDAGRDAGDDADDVVIDLPAPELSLSALRKMADLTLTTPVAPAPARAHATPVASASGEPEVASAPRAARRLQSSTEMVSAHDIVAELRSLTAEPGVSFGQVQEITDLLVARTAQEEPVAKPRKKLGSPAAARFAEAAAITNEEMAPEGSTAQPVVAKFAGPVAEPVVAGVLHTVIEPVTQPMVEQPLVQQVVDSAVASAPFLPQPAQTAMPSRTPVTHPAAGPVAAPQVEVVPATAIDVLPAAPRPRPAGAPSRRHVELTLAAADQLIDSLTRTGRAQKLSVRVVLRSGDQREVEAEAQWECAPERAGTTGEAA